MPAAYLIIEARIRDPDGFAAYARAVPELMTRHGGQYVVMRGQQQWLEGGDDASRTVVSLWPDRDAALAFWHSADYARLKQLRAATGDFRVRLVDAVADPPKATEPLTGSTP